MYNDVLALLETLFRSLNDRMHLLNKLAERRAAVSQNTLHRVVWILELGRLMRVETLDDQANVPSFVRLWVLASARVASAKIRAYANSFSCFCLNA